MKKYKNMFFDIIVSFLLSTLPTPNVMNVCKQDWLNFVYEASDDGLIYAQFSEWIS